MPRQFDFTNGPDKIFVEATNTAIGPGRLLLAMHSGENAHVFVFDINHAKQLSRLLTQNVEHYEKQFGPVDGRLPTEPLPTPFKYNDDGKDSGANK